MALVFASVLLAVTPAVAHASAPGCPGVWDRFWADLESCVIHGPDQDLETCCYWEDGALIGCCQNAAT